MVAAAVIGTLLWARDNKQWILAMFLGALGGSLSDAPLLTNALFNLVTGQRLLEGCDTRPIVGPSGELLHSMLTYGVILILTRSIESQPVRSAVRCIASGALMHILFDALSHGKGTANYSTGYLWPLGEYLGQWGRLGYWIGIWDYSTHDGFMPKPDEWILFLGCILWTYYLFIYRPVAIKYKIVWAKKWWKITIRLHEEEPAMAYAASGD